MLASCASWADTLQVLRDRQPGMLVELVRPLLDVEAAGTPQNSCGRTGSKLPTHARLPSTSEHHHGQRSSKAIPKHLEGDANLASDDLRVNPSCCLAANTSSCSTTG